MSVLEQDSRKKMLLGQDGNSLVLLIAFNAIVFVILNFIKVIYLLNNSSVPVFNEEVLSWVVVPAQPNLFATRPWTLILYMFTHISVWHLFSSMMWLWVFGYFLQDLSGNKKLIPIYLYGGLAGSVLYLLTLNLVPALRAHVNTFPSLIGAEPALMAVAVATTTLSPRYKILPLISGGIPLWIITALFAVLTFSTVGMSNPGSAASLVAGGLVGYLFVWQLNRGNDWGQWMNDMVNWIDDLFNPEKKHIQKPKKQQLYYKSTQKPFEKTPHVTQQRIDDLLDKINQKGYHSLSEEEKEFLKKASSEEL